jgi:hypothetical protein
MSTAPTTEPVDSPNPEAQGSTADDARFLRPGKKSLEKRFAKLTRDKHEARQEAEELRDENATLKEIIRRYDTVIERYKIQLLQRRRHVR